MKYPALVFLLLLTVFPAKAAHKNRWDDFKNEWSVLMLQIYHHETEKYLDLIRHSTEEELNFTSRSFRVTPLEVAIRTNNDTAARALLETNKIRNPKTFIVVASGCENAAIMKMLLDLGADPNTLVNKKNRYSVLVYAVNFGSLEVVDCLLKHGADVNLSLRRRGMSPLAFALLNGYADKAELLIKNGASTRAKTNDGRLPVDFHDWSYKYSRISGKDWERLRALLEKN